MRKLLVGLFALCVFAFSASVSFASDGPKTTKDCVFDISDAMEVSVNIEENVKASFDATVSTASLTGEKSVSITAEAKNTIDLFELKDQRYNILEDYGLVRRSDRSKVETINIGYRYQLNCYRPMLC